MSTLLVVIKRLPSRRLVATVRQQSADGPRVGKNILGRGVRRIETAKKRAIKKLGEYYNLEFAVDAEPDLVRAKKH